MVVETLDESTWPVFLDRQIVLQSLAVKTWVASHGFIYLCGEARVAQVMESSQEDQRKSDVKVVH
jgi:hypothetical protein